MSKLIRKISIGKDYKNDAMHYAVGQEVYGGHIICDILEGDDKYSIYIRKENDVLPWKAETPDTVVYNLGGMPEVADILGLNMAQPDASNFS